MDPGRCIFKLKLRRRCDDAAFQINPSFTGKMQPHRARTMGLHFPRERWVDLERGIVTAAAELQFEDTAAWIHWALGRSPTKSQLEILASHLTVGETYFFRESRHFDALAEQILP